MAAAFFLVATSQQIEMHHATTRSYLVMLKFEFIDALLYLWVPPFTYGFPPVILFLEAIFGLRLHSATLILLRRVRSWQILTGKVVH